ncbi:CB1 cannabinoid receptor-interacting protein 1 isoform X2 [Dromiciops gliroides]|uniref:CB1 cannabinoid receptor-interacting protein 1 isoform X2 n=1 Tax=Dromiciops gliroides TaxID=33562 RepID=UPI001CC5436F|nr:CB1 cannabinoid receptor-interacting protein 1 isoform X2 [Dromiciops gliroides]
MGDLPSLVRLSIALRIQPNDGPVFFKVDGQRFGQNRTIKLLTGSSYKVEVKIKPTTLQVKDISIGGVLVPLELKSKEPDGDRVVYTGIYDTEGVAPTKSGERQPIQITMPIYTLHPSLNKKAGQLMIKASYLAF